VAAVIDRLAHSTPKTSLSTNSCQICGGSGWLVKDTDGGVVSTECSCVVEDRYKHWLAAVEQQTGQDLIQMYNGLDMLSEPSDQATWIHPDNPKARGYQPSPRHRKQVNQFYKQANQWVIEFARNPGLAFLWGRPGRGKSHLAALAAALYVRLRATPWDSYTNNASLVAVIPERNLRESYTFQWKDEEQAAKLRAWEKAPLLVLDDLGGAADYSDSYLAYIRTLLEARLTNRGATVFTSNLSMGKLYERGIVGPRQRSRMNLIPKANQIEFGVSLPDSRPAVAQGV